MENKKYNIAILGSTKGTSITLLLKEYADNSLNNINIKLIISNKSNAPILSKAENTNIKAIYLPPDNLTREEYDIKLDNILTENEINLVLLVGYMKIITPFLVNKWKYKIVNIHPSLLPAFGGMMNKSVHQTVLDRGCKISGATIMYIDEGPDTGPIIDQIAVSVSNNDTVDTLKEKIQNIENTMILQVVKLHYDNKIEIIDGKVKIID